MITYDLSEKIYEEINLDMDQSMIHRSPLTTSSERCPFPILFPYPTSIHRADGSSRYIVSQNLGRVPENSGPEKYLKIILFLIQTLRTKRLPRNSKNP